MIENHKRRCREAKLEMSLTVLARTAVDKGSVGSDYLRILDTLLSSRSKSSKFVMKSFYETVVGP